jgi:L-ribulokinase
VFRPDPRSVKVYAELYKLYKQLHDGFGGIDRDKPSAMGNVMKDLIAIRDRVRKG